jgi:hypothetical protein
MAWEVEFTDEFNRWWDSLTENQQDDVAYSVGLLTKLGPALGFPHSSKIIGSRHPGMRELRTQSSGRPLRTLYAFDLLRVAILLVGGTRRGLTGGMKHLSRWRTVSTMSISVKSGKRTNCNAYSKLP